MLAPPGLRSNGTPYRTGQEAGGHIAEVAFPQTPTPPVSGPERVGTHDPRFPGLAVAWPWQPPRPLWSQ